MKRPQKNSNSIEEPCNNFWYSMESMDPVSKTPSKLIWAKVNDKIICCQNIYGLQTNDSGFRSHAMCNDIWKHKNQGCTGGAFRPRGEAGRGKGKSLRGKKSHKSTDFQPNSVPMYLWLVVMVTSTGLWVRQIYIGQNWIRGGVGFIPDQISNLPKNHRHLWFTKRLVTALCRSLNDSFQTFWPKKKN